MVDGCAGEGQAAARLNGPDLSRNVAPFRLIWHETGEPSPGEDYDGQEKEPTCERRSPKSGHPVGAGVR